MTVSMLGTSCAIYTVLHILFEKQCSTSPTNPNPNPTNHYEVVLHNVKTVQITTVPDMYSSLCSSDASMSIAAE